MRIKIKGDIQVFEDGAEILESNFLRKLGALSYREERCSDYFSRDLSNLNLVGGQIELLYDEHQNKLFVVSDFFCDRKLSDSELESLIAEITGQWSDGMGENFSGQYEMETGIKLDLRPFKQTVTSEQIDDGSSPPSETTSPLFASLENVSKLGELLRAGESPNQRDSSGLTVLQTAIREGLVDAAILLIEAGADVDAQENDKFTKMSTLSLASMIAMNEEKRLRIARALLDHGADVNARDGDESGGTPLRWAANRGNKELVELYIQHGADVNEQLEDSYTPLSSCREIEVAKLLLKHGANPLLGPYGMTCSEALDKNNQYQDPRRYLASASHELRELLASEEEKAKPRAMQKAESGDANWQYRLSQWYQKGTIFPRNEQKAFEWCQKAAEQNHPNALLQLGLWYYDGDPPAKRDLGRATNLLARASEFDIPVATFILGACYLDGKGVKTDRAKGITLCKRAAEQGFIPAYAELGEVYETGKGVAKDLPEALRLYEFARRHGFEPPQLLEAIKRVRKALGKPVR